MPHAVQQNVLIEAGFRCAGPTCRMILAMDLHHMEEVSEGGSNDPGNLLPLCPNCHRLYHQRHISREAIYAWKGMLIALSQAFDRDSIDMLMFLTKPHAANMLLDSNGVLRYAGIISADLAAIKQMEHPEHSYKVELTAKGAALISAWQVGDRIALASALAGGEIEQVSRRLSKIEEKERPSTIQIPG